MWTMVVVSYFSDMVVDGVEEGRNMVILLYSSAQLAEVLPIWEFFVEGYPLGMLRMIEPLVSHASAWR